MHARGFLPVLHSVKGALGVRTYFIVLAQDTAGVLRENPVALAGSPS